jgi:hypothetical protein
LRIEGAPSPLYLSWAVLYRQLDGDQRYVEINVNATVGMVAYRSGDFALGAKCYGIAIADFVTAKDKSTLAYGILMWLRERAAAGDALVGEEYAHLKPHLVAVTKFRKEPEVETMIEVIESDLRRAVLPNVARAGVSSDELQQTFAQFKPDRRVISLRDRVFEDL